MTDLVTDLLWPVRLSVLCHPQLQEQHRGADLAAFIAANEIIHVRLNDLPRHHLWTQFVRHLGLTGLNVERGLVFDTAMLAVQYALSGDGIVLVDTTLFAEHVRHGRLVQPFDVTFDEGYGYYLLTHPEALGDAAIAMFRSWLIERLGPAGAREQDAGSRHLRNCATGNAARARPPLGRHRSGTAQAEHRGDRPDIGRSPRRCPWSSR